MPNRHVLLIFLQELLKHKLFVHQKLSILVLAKLILQCLHIDHWLSKLRLVLVPFEVAKQLKHDLIVAISIVEVTLVLLKTLAFVLVLLLLRDSFGTLDLPKLDFV